jgi:hypothetical protein
VETALNDGRLPSARDLVPEPSTIGVVYNQNVPALKRPAYREGVTECTWRVFEDRAHFRAIVLAVLGYFREEGFPQRHSS